MLGFDFNVLPNTFQQTSVNWSSNNLMSLVVRTSFVLLNHTLNVVRKRQIITVRKIFINIRNIQKNSKIYIPNNRQITMLNSFFFIRFDWHVWFLESFFVYEFSITEILPQIRLFHYLKLLLWQLFTSLFIYLFTKFECRQF